MAGARTRGTTAIERWVWSLQNDSVVAGGGAIEMELSKYLRDYSRTIPGKQQLLIGAYAKALEIIPRQLCDNAGFDATNILNKLRARHAQVGASSPWGPGVWRDGLDSVRALSIRILCSAQVTVLKLNSEGRGKATVPGLEVPGFLELLPRVITPHGAKRGALWPLSEAHTGEALRALLALSPAMALPPLRELRFFICYLANVFKCSAL